MPSILNQLQDPQAILLLYLADELSPEDRHEVDQLLASNSDLRDSLAQLRLAQDAAIIQLQTLEQLDPVRASIPAAARKATAAIKQWQVDRLARPVEPPALKGLRFPWWVYPAISVAAIVIATTVWWGMQPDVIPTAHPDASTEATRSTQTETIIPPATPDTPVQEQIARNDLPFASEENAAIVEAERQASTLSRRSDSVSVAASIFMADAGSELAGEETNTP